MRDMLGHVAKTQQPLIAAAIRGIFQAANLAEARARLVEVVGRLAAAAPKIARLLEASEPDLLAFYELPREHWSKLRSTNPLERVNREIGRRTDVVGIFPNDAAVLRLAGALLIEQNDEWLIARRYLSQESLELVLVDEPVTQEATQLTKALSRPTTILSYTTSCDLTPYDLHAMTRDEQDRVQLHCKLGTYYHSLSTSECLDPELLEAYAAWPDSRPEQVWPRLERRAWLHERVPDPVADGRYRSAAIGVSTLTIVRVRNRTFDGYKMFLSPRSVTVATQRRRYHVVPSGMFQPFIPGDSRDLLQGQFSVADTVMREFVEELYGVEELETGDGRVDPQAIYHRREARLLSDMLSAGDAALLYSGVAVNLLALRPEICTVLIIHDPRWWERECGELRICDEYLQQCEQAELLPDQRWVQLIKGELDCAWAAQAYAALGYPVVPMHAIRPGCGCTCRAGPACPEAGKHPQLAGWMRLASTDPGGVGRWWRRWPQANVGLVTGRRLDVLDLDGDQGVEALRAALQIAPQEHPGPVARTGSDGWHLLYAPSGLGNRVRLLPGVDWRGRGGLIVAPPSQHASGRRYAWVRPLTATLPELPGVLRRLLAPPPATRATRPPSIPTCRREWWPGRTVRPGARRAARDL